MKKFFTKEVTIGLSVIVALVILFFGIDYLKGINIFKPANFYYAYYDNVSGLEVAAPVTIDGYKVGQVREINFSYDKPGKVEVLLALNNKLRLPKDSKAVIESTLLSGAFIKIERGQSAQMLEMGATLPSGVTPDLMASVSNEILPSVGAIIPKIDSLLINLNAITSDPAIYQSLSRFDGITYNLLGASRGLNKTLTADIPLIAGNVNHVVFNLDSMTRNLGNLSWQLKTLPIHTTMENVNRATGNAAEMTENLRALSEQLRNPNSTLGLLTSDPELYNRILKVSADVDSLILDIQRNPKRYISIKLL